MQRNKDLLPPNTNGNWKGDVTMLEYFVVVVVVVVVIVKINHI